jgi:hypothetical protein
MDATTDREGPMKVLLVDDHPLILSALQTVIRGLGDDVVVDGVDSAAGARAVLRRDATTTCCCWTCRWVTPTASTCWSNCADLAGTAGGGGVGVRAGQ